MEPIQPHAIFSLLSAGYPVDLVLPATVRALNGVYGRTIHGGMRRASDPEFSSLLEALRRMQDSRALSITVRQDGDERVVKLLWNTRNKPEVEADVRYIAKLLNLEAVNGEVRLVYGAVQAQRDELAVLSRSMIEILSGIAGDIQVPEEDVRNGRTLATADESTADPNDRSRVKIYSTTSLIPPPDTFVSVRYNGNWYWISDRDVASKRAFTFLSLFFSLAETGVVPAAPQLTIPVQ